MAGAEVENWFKELIYDKIVIEEQATGGYLDGMFMSGDQEAGLYKFPVIGRLESVELSGAIEKVSADDASMNTVEMRPADFEAATWYRQQDIYKMGPSHQTALAQLVTMAINRRKDTIKWNALYTFCPTFNAGGNAYSVGGDAVVADPRYLDMASGQIAAAGFIPSPGSIFCPLPHRAFDQLAQYKHWSCKDWVAPEDAPFSKSARTTMKMRNNVLYFALPDEHFTYSDGDGSSGAGYFDTFMWAKNSVGAETPWNKMPPSMTQHADYAGSPWLIKGQVGGCAVGIRQAGVKRIRFLANMLPERETLLTEAAS